MAAAAAQLLPPDDLGPEGRDDTGRTVIRLEYATVAWNLVEVVVAIAAGVAARSLALVAFGLDSLVEVFASSVVIAHTRQTSTAAAVPHRRALRLIAASFVFIGAWLVVGAAVALAGRHHPSQSGLGIAFMGVTVVMMLALAQGKLRAGRKLGSEPVVANARLTFLDGCVAAGVCLALLLDRGLGWWWFDAAAAGVIGLVALWEGAVRCTVAETRR